MRTSPWRLLRVDHRRHLPDRAGEAAVEPYRRDLRGHSGVDRRRVLLRQCARISISPPAAMPEQRRRAGADDLADLDAARQHQARAGGANVEPADLGARARRAAPGRRGHGHLRRRARRACDRFRPWRRSRAPAARRRDRIGLGQRGIGPRDLDRGGELRRLLRPGPNGRRPPAPGPQDPAAGIDEHVGHSAARAGHADRLVATGGKRRRLRLWCARPRCARGRPR